MNAGTVLRALGAAAALGLICSTPAARADVPPTIKVAVTTNAGYEVYFAQELGMFQRAGLDVQAQVFVNGATIASAISGHDLQVGVSNVVTIAQAREHGLPFTLIAPETIYTSAAPNTQCVVLPDSPIRTAKDLNGKMLGTVSVAGILRLAMDAWIDRNGGDSASVKFVEVPPGEMVVAMQRGTIAAAQMVDPMLTAARPNVRIVGSPLDAIGRKLIVTGWFAANDWVAQNPQTVGAFAKVMADAARWANDPKNKARAAEIIAKYTHSQSDPGSTVYAAAFKDAPMQPILDTALQYKLLTQPVKANDIIART